MTNLIEINLTDSDIEDSNILSKPLNIELDQIKHNQPSQTAIDFNSLLDLNFICVYADEDCPDDRFIGLRSDTSYISYVYEKEFCKKNNIKDFYFVLGNECVKISLPSPITDWSYRIRYRNTDVLSELFSMDMYVGKTISIFFRTRHGKPDRFSRKLDEISINKKIDDGIGANEYVTYECCDTRNPLPKSIIQYRSVSPFFHLENIPGFIDRLRDFRLKNDKSSFITKRYHSMIHD